MVDLLARGFDAEGHDVLLFTTGDSTCPVPKASVYARASAEIGVAAFEMRHVIHAYDAVQNYDVVHDHTVIGPVYAAQFPELRVTTTNHGPFDDELSDIYRVSARRVPIIAISHSQAATAPPDVPIARVIHHGVDPDHYTVGDGRGGYLAFVGRMNPAKGVAEAVQIARTAGVPLKIAAKMREPAELEYYESEVAPLLDGELEYVGELGDDDLQTLLGGASALLNPIQWPEPFGLVMIEALVCGTPVLALDRGAAPEIVQDGVTGFIRRHGEELVPLVDRIRDIDRAACRRSVEDYFSIRRMVSDHLTFFEELIRA